MPLRLSQAVILAGGKGTRLGNLAKNIPKPMMDIRGVPFLEILVRLIASQGIEHFIFSLGHLPEPIIKHFGDGSKMGIRITYLIEPYPMGTGGFLHLLPESADDHFLVANGDSFFDIDLSVLYDVFVKNRADAAIALARVEDASRFDRVILDKDRISAFAGKGKTGPGLVNGGVYIFSRNPMHQAQFSGVSLENDIFPALVKKKTLYGAVFPDTLTDIGIPASLEKARQILEVR